MENMETENSKLSIPMAILVVGVLIAGAILLKGSKPAEAPAKTNNGTQTAEVAPVSENDRTLGNKDAKVALVLYEDFQCPFCGAVSGSLKPDAQVMQYIKTKLDPNWQPFMPGVMSDYVNTGKVLLVYRDWAFLGPESIKSAEAGRCAQEQGKFWEYHDYLFSHQGGENQGAFSDTNLKSFAKKLSLDTTAFDKCLDSGKYEEAVKSQRAEGTAAGVQGTPKGFILKDGKTVSTIDGAESLPGVKQKIEEALK